MAQKIKIEERKHQQISPEDDDDKNIIGKITKYALNGNINGFI